MEYEHIVHSFEPVYDKASEILILGTLPSVKSRENNFYYGHKQNRFWKVLATLLKEPVPHTIEEKKAMLLAHRIALWDVIQSCDIKGSSDSSIKKCTADGYWHDSGKNEHNTCLCKRKQGRTAL